MNKSITTRQKQLLETIYQFLKNSGYPPTFEEMRENIGVSSNQSILDLLIKLETLKVIKRDEQAARGLVILPLGYKMLEVQPLAPMLGATSAGIPIEAGQLNDSWQTIGKDVAQYQQDVFLLKVFGDSMINAGIDDGDMVLVKNHKEFVSRDIVLAQIGDESTVKRFISEDKPPYVYLKPENPKYDIILFKDDVELKGKIISVFNNNTWKQIK